jgi:hypothetical protein
MSIVEITIIDIISIVMGIISIVVGIMAIVLSNNSEKRSKKNFEQIMKINKLINKKLNIVDEELEHIISSK